MLSVNKSRGFTLIELLVTISIIAILFAIGLMAYSAVLKQGRDSKRQSDLRSIQSALEQYYSDQGFYPTGNFTGLDTLFYTDQTPVFNSSTGNPSPAASKTYMNLVPRDPTYTGTGRYYYWASPDACDNSNVKCASYCLYAWLEDSTPPANSKPQIGNCTNNTPYTFVVTPP